jgi:Tfp pilus assembly protein PilO
MTHKRVFFALLVVCGLVVVGLGFGTKLGLDRVSEEKHKISSMLAQLAAADEKLSLTIRTQTQLEQLSFIQTIADGVLPDEKAQPELVGQILLIADNNNIGVDNITFSGQSAQAGVAPDITQAEPLLEIPGVYTIPLNITIRGDYDDMLDMLRDTEQNRRKMQVSSITIKPVIGDEGQPTEAVLATIVVDVYVRPQLAEGESL